MTLDADINSLFSTNYGPNPYISFTLDAPYSSSLTVTLIARNDRWAVLQFKNYTVSVSTSPTPGSGTVCASGLTATSMGQEFEVGCPGVANARYVIVSRTGITGYLSLAEASMTAPSTCPPPPPPLRECPAPAAHATCMLVGKRLSSKAWLRNADAPMFSWPCGAAWLARNRLRRCESVCIVLQRRGARWAWRSCQRSSPRECCVHVYRRPTLFACMLNLILV